MALKNYSQEEIEDLSMIELAKKILTDNNKAVDFREIYDQIAALKGFSDEEKQTYIAQFYTDLNIDGSFLTVGSNLWGLKRWYPIDQIDEEITAAAKKKKKKKKAATTKKKKKKEEVVDESEDVTLDEEELDFDDTDLDDFDDADLEDDDFDFDDDDEDYDNSDDDDDESDDDKKDE